MKTESNTADFALETDAPSGQVESSVSRPQPASAQAAEQTEQQVIPAPSLRNGSQSVSEALDDDSPKSKAPSFNLLSSVDSPSVEEETVAPSAQTNNVGASAVIAENSEEAEVSVENDFGASAVIAENSEEAEASEGESTAKPALTGSDLLKAKVALEERIVDQIHTIFDPEIPVDIYELGLIYDIKVADDFGVVVQMTLTSPACPVAGSLVLEVEDKTLAVEDVKSARVELVWDPPWTPDMMSEAAQLELGFF